MVAGSSRGGLGSWEGKGCVRGPKTAVGIESEKGIKYGTNRSWDAVFFTQSLPNMPLDGYDVRGAIWWPWGGAQGAHVEKGDSQEKAPQVLQRRYFLRTASGVSVRANFQALYLTVPMRLRQVAEFPPRTPMAPLEGSIRPLLLAPF